MKKILLTIGFLSSFSSFGTDNFVPYKDLLFKDKLSQRFIGKDNRTILAKKMLLDQCMHGKLNSEGIKICETIKTRISLINGTSLLSKMFDRFFGEPLDASEHIAVNHAVDLIDKNIKRAKAQDDIDSIDSKTIEKAIESLAWKYCIRGRFGFLNADYFLFKNIVKNMELCASGPYLEEKNLEECSEMKGFIQKYISQLESDDEKIAQVIVNAMGANIEYTQVRKKYFDLIKDLYN